MLDISAGILALKDKPSLFGGKKYLSDLGGRSLISMVTDVAFSLAKEVIVIATSDDEAKALSDTIAPLAGEVAYVVCDAFGEGTELSMAETALARSSCSKTILLPGDAPFLSLEVLTTMAELCKWRDAVVSRSPVGEAIPFPAIYDTEKALAAIRASRSVNASRMNDALQKLTHVMYLSSDVLAELDNGLLTFFSVYSPLDLRKAELILSGRFPRGRKKKSG